MKFIYTHISGPLCFHLRCIGGILSHAASLASDGGRVGEVLGGSGCVLERLRAAEGTVERLCDGVTAQVRALHFGCDTPVASCVAFVRKLE